MKKLYRKENEKGIAYNWETLWDEVDLSTGKVILHHGVLNVFQEHGQPLRKVVNECSFEAFKEGALKEEILRVFDEQTLSEIEAAVKHLMHD